MSSTSLSMCDVVKAPTLSDSDMLVISENESEAPQDLSLSDIGNGEVAVQFLNLSQYFFEDVYLKTDQIVYLAFQM